MIRYFVRALPYGPRLIRLARRLRLRNVARRVCYLFAPGRANKNPYNRDYIRGRRESARSASRVVPEVIALVAPRSVVDVGCGPAGWIAEFREAGISDVIGIDGDWVDRDLLLISPELFRAHDLRQPLSLDRMFDLALCLEVAEHLPAERAGPLVSELTKLAPVVLFSAAIPGQGGNGHINEQWPDYWATMFEKSSYVPLDCLRSRFWSDGQIEWCYRQNMILYARRDYVEAHRQLKATFDRQPRCVLRLVHPEG